MALTSPIAFYKFDDATDASGNSRTLTPGNTPTYNTGVVGNAAYLASASNQYFSRADAAFNIADDWFGSAWVYPSSALFMVVAGKYDPSLSNNRAWLMYHNANRTVTFEASVTGPTSATVNSGATLLTQNTWTHLIWERDRTNGKLNLYVNNGSVIQSNLSGTNQNQTSTTDFRVSYYQGSSGFWNGRIDALGLFPGLSTPADRTALYNAGAGKEPPFSNRRRRVLMGVN